MDPSNLSKLIEGPEESNTKAYSFRYLFCLSLLVCSPCLSFFFISRALFRSPELNWSSRAATEAEAVAALSCSGHGSAFVDGILVDGKHVCECNTCYRGPDCSEFVRGCAADAERWLCWCSIGWIKFSLLSISTRENPLQFCLHPKTFQNLKLRSWLDCKLVHFYHQAYQ